MMCCDLKNIMCVCVCVCVCLLLLSSVDIPDMNVNHTNVQRCLVVDMIVVIIQFTFIGT
jgi:hypothetical protein